MKKNIFYLGIIALTFYLSACKKIGMDEKYQQKNIKELIYTPSKKVGQSNKLDEAPKPIHYSLIDGRLAFESEEDFNTIVTYIEEEEIIDWQNSIGFHSLYTENATETEALGDNQVAAVLNNKGIIQVQNYIFKLIPTTRTVLVMSKDNIASLPILEAASEGSSIIQSFSFDDEVFSILEEQGGVSPENPDDAAKSICRDRRANEKDDPYSFPYFYGRDNYVYRMNVEYKKIGISVKLYSHYENYWPTSPSGGNILGQNLSYFLRTAESTFDIEYFYTPRCRPSVNGTLHFTVTNKKKYDVITYRDTRDCKNYKLITTFSFKTLDGVHYFSYPFLTRQINDF